MLPANDARARLAKKCLIAIERHRDEKGRVDLTKLTGFLAQIKKDQPDQSAITLQTEDAVLYDDLVRIIDNCIGSQFPSVSVSPAST